jgi:hypothetical protein
LARYGANHLRGQINPRDGAPAPSLHKKEAKMARVLTLSALYVMVLGTFFGAYAMAL